MNAKKPEIVIGVGALIKDRQNRILLVRQVQRKMGFSAGKWIVPAGKIKLGESLKEAVKREVKEETGLKITLIRHLLTGDRIIKKDAEIKLHIIYIDFLTKPTKGKLSPRSDVEKAKWFTVKEILENPDKIHPDIKRLLKKAKLIQ